MSSDAADGDRYCVVRNDEEQYSIWRTGAPIPAGWQAVGQEGSRAECLEYIEQVWTDMRPLSLRRPMNGSRA